MISQRYGSGTISTPPDVAVGNGAFTTLVKIVSDLGLVDTLKGVEAVTIFAPSDEAFAKLPEGTLESLTPEQAKAIVSRHVVAGATVMAADVATGSVETLGGESIDRIKAKESKPKMVVFKSHTMETLSMLSLLMSKQVMVSSM